MERNPKDGRAALYLGNVLYDWQPDEAVKCWERAAALEPALALTHRNLAVAYSHQPAGLQKAIAALETAVAQEKKYPLHFTELDELYERAGVAPEKRLALLEKNHEVVSRRDDAVAREASLQVTMGRYEDAIRLLTGRKFSVWEGANLPVAEDWANAHLLRGRQRLEKQQYQEALADFQAAVRIPDNLPSEGGNLAAFEKEAGYWTGMAYTAMGNQQQARQAWEGVAQESGQRMAGRRRPLAGTAGYYQGLALQKLGKAADAKSVLEEVARNSEQAIQSPEKPHPAALVDDEQGRRERLIAAHYSAGLAYKGLGDAGRAKAEFQETLGLQPAHTGARSMLSDLAR
jgi:tetratricopeptide (TPR) repeat protein